MLPQALPTRSIFHHALHRFRLFKIALAFAAALHTVHPIYATNSLTSTSTSRSKPVSTIFVKRIIIEGVQHLSKRTRKKLLAPYTNVFLSAAQIKQLTQKIRAHFISRGYTTVHVQVSLSKDVQNGILKLKVVHGFIEEIRLGKNRGREKLQLALAFPFLRGKPLLLLIIRL